MEHVPQGVRYLLSYKKDTETADRVIQLDPGAFSVSKPKTARTTTKGATREHVFRLDVKDKRQGGASKNYKMVLALKTAEEMQGWMDTFGSEVAAAEEEEAAVARPRVVTVDETAVDHLASVKRIDVDMDASELEKLEGAEFEALCPGPTGALSRP